jgi:hypothetical protein
MKKKKSKIVLVFDKSRDLISIYASAKETGMVLGVSPRAVSNCCDGVSIMCKDRYLRYLHPDVKISTYDCFETIDLIQYDELCGETRFYWYETESSRPGKRQKMTADQIKLLESNVKNKALARLHEFYPHNLVMLAQYGWFIDIYSNQYFRKKLEARSLDEGNIGGFNKVITKFYKTHVNDIIEAICDRHPRRRHFLSEQVMSSYNLGHYELAITGVLSQIDGICNDKFGGSFFIKKKNDNKEFIPVIAYDLLKVQNDFFKLFITPILHDCPIFVHYTKVDGYPSKLNRHRALHGMDISFGSEEAFYKSVSLLKYVSDMLHFSDICTKNGRYIERYMYSKSDWA